MRKILLTIYITLSVFICKAELRPLVTNFSTIEINADRQNWAVSQGANGWIYFANSSGILEYNGYNWNIHRVEGIQTIRTINCASNGNIYVGGDYGFGYYSPDKFGRMIYSDLTSLVVESDFQEIWDIHIINERVLFRTRRSFIVYENNKCKVIPINGLVLASCQMNNNIYFATTNGVYVLGDGSPILLNGSDSQRVHGTVSAMTAYSDSEILIATSFDGLYLYSDGNFRPFKTEYDEILSKNQIFSIAVSGSKIACGTVRGGVVLIDRKDCNCKQVNINSGMGNNTVLSLGFDNDDNLWCGLDNGIDKVSLSSPLLHFDINKEYRFTGYCALVNKDYTYFGTNQGLVRSAKNNDAIMVANSDGQVWNIQNIGNKIYCSHNRGLFILKEHPTTPTLEPIYANDGVWGLTEIDSNHYLMGTYEGLELFNIENNEVKTIENYRGSARDVYFHKNSNSAFLVSSKGLEKISFTSDFQVISSGLVIENDFYNIKLLQIDGSLLVYSPEEIYLVADAGTLEPTTKYDNLFDKGTLYTMISVDERKNIWYIIGNKLLKRKYDSIKKEYSNLQQIFDDPYFFVDGFTTITPLDERYYIISNIYGYSVVDSYWRESQYKSVKPRIISLFDTNNRDSLLLSTSYGVEPKNIVLPYNQNSLKITFANNSISDGTSEYSYQLKGNDGEWSKWGAINEIVNQKEYTRLREGEYTFTLRLKDKLGRVEECNLGIKILPPWQRSTPMYIVYFPLVCCLLIYLRYRVTKYYAFKQRLLELQKEREIANQKRQFISKSIEQENNIIRLKNEKLESEVVAKSTELSNLLLNQLEKNDIIMKVKSSVDKINKELNGEQLENAQQHIVTLNKWLDDKQIDNVNWGAFEENFNLINNGFVQKITQRFAWMNTNERKLCVYIKMGLQNKEIAPLLNLSIRGVEMLRYRVRKKMEIDRNSSLYEFLQNI